MITFRNLESTIVGTVDGKPFNIARTEDNEKAIQTFADSNAGIDEVMEFVKSTHSQEIAGSSKYLIFNPISKEYYLQFDKFRSKQPIPWQLQAYIEESYDKNLDFLPVLKAWARLLTNPRYTPAMASYFSTYISTCYLDKAEKTRLMEDDSLEEQTATNIATYQDIAITQEGLLATYKVAEMVTWKWVMEADADGVFHKVQNPLYKVIPAVLDPTTGTVLEEEKIIKPAHLEEFLFTPAIWKSGDKFYSGNKLGYVYKVGEVQSLPKNARRNLNNSNGGGGLYIGGLNYIEFYRGGDHNHVLTCFVDPADILSFQSEGNAIRVDALMPYNVWDEEATLKGMYHSSDYGKMSAERVDELIKEAVANDVDIIKETQRINDARNAGSLELVEE